MAVAVEAEARAGLRSMGPRSAALRDSQPLDVAARWGRRRRYDSFSRSAWSCSSDSSPGHLQKRALIPVWEAWGASSARTSSGLKSGRGAWAHREASRGEAASTSSASIRSTVPEGVKRAIPDTITVLPMSVSSRSESMCSALPRSWTPGSRMRVKLRSLWMTSFSVPATRTA